VARNSAECSIQKWGVEDSQGRDRIPALTIWTLIRDSDYSEGFCAAAIASTCRDGPDRCGRRDGEWSRIDLGRGSGSGAVGRVVDGGARRTRRDGNGLRTGIHPGSGRDDRCGGGHRKDGNAFRTTAVAPTGRNGSDRSGLRDGERSRINQGRGGRSGTVGSVVDGGARRALRDGDGLRAGIHPGSGRDYRRRSGDCKYGEALGTTAITPTCRDGSDRSGRRDGERSRIDLGRGSGSGTVSRVVDGGARRALRDGDGLRPGIHAGNGRDYRRTGRECEYGEGDWTRIVAAACRHGFDGRGRSDGERTRIDLRSGRGVGAVRRVIEPSPWSGTSDGDRLCRREHP
jgi:hypothetical protein